MQMEHEQESVLAGALKGAVAGGIAVWVMDQVDWYMYNHEDRKRGGRPNAFALVDWTRPTSSQTKWQERSARNSHPATRIQQVSPFTIP